MAKKLEDEGAVPLKVITIVFNETAPAESAAKVKVPISSFVPFERADVKPIAAAVTLARVLNTVIVLPVAEESVTAEVAFEVEPSATTVSATVSFTLSVEVEILKTCVVLSVAPLEVYEDTSPFKTNEIEPAFGTISGLAKWNW